MRTLRRGCREEVVVEKGADACSCIVIKVHGSRQVVVEVVVPVTVDSRRLIRVSAQY
jgi:hypothetical protein